MSKAARVADVDIPVSDGKVTGLVDATKSDTVSKPDCVLASPNASEFVGLDGDSGIVKSVFRADVNGSVFDGKVAGFVDAAGSGCVSVFAGPGVGRAPLALLPDEKYVPSRPGVMDGL